MTSGSSLTPVNVLTGFLGSGKTTLLQRLLRSPRMKRTAVLINEFGEIGLDHLLVQQVDESVVLLQSGCICCSIRDDLKSALRGLLSRRERHEIPAFDRVVIETTGLADPGPILYTLLSEPVIRHHFQLGNVITTVDVVNAELHLSTNREGIKQVAAADRLVLTKSDLAEPEQTAAVTRRTGASESVRPALGRREGSDGRRFSAGSDAFWRTAGSRTVPPGARGSARAGVHGGQTRRNGRAAPPHRFGVELQPGP